MTSASNLRKHIKIIHIVHIDYKCDFCEKSFTSAGSVRGHIKNIHKGHKHFKCDSCGKLLISKSLTEFILVNDFPQKSHL